MALTNGNIKGEIFKKSANDHVQSIKEELDKKNIDKAEKTLYETEFDKFPKIHQGEMYWMLAEISFLKGDWMMALEFKQKAVDFNPNLEHYESSKDNFNDIDKYAHFKIDA